MNNQLFIHTNNPYYFEATMPYLSQIYVKREADELLKNLFESRVLGKVFNARKQGKSSLLNKVTSELGDDYIKIHISMSTFDNLKKDNKKLDDLKSIFYRDLMIRFAQQLDPLGLDIDANDIDKWIDKYAKGYNCNANMLSMMFKFILSGIRDKAIIIIFDEIDRVKALPFSSDDFFGCIRDTDEMRRQYGNEDYQRLIFCLVGVIKTSDLIRQGTPFNVGTDIDVSRLRFNDETKKVLITLGLKERYEDAEEALRYVLERSNGEPYLTQKLLSKMFENAKSIIPKHLQESEINKIEQEWIVNNWRHHDGHDYFKYIEKRICRPKLDEQGNELQEMQDERKTAKLLRLYEQILRGKQCITYQATDDQVELVLSGIVFNDNGVLKPSSPIHEQIFNFDWIEEKLDSIRPDEYRERLEAWEKSNKQDKSCLLHGKMLRKYQKYSFLNHDRDGVFIEKSQEEYNKFKGALLQSFPDDLDREKILDNIYDWVNPHLENQLFFELINIVTNRANEFQQKKQDLFHPEGLDDLVTTWVNEIVEQYGKEDWRRITEFNIEKKNQYLLYPEEVSAIINNLAKENLLEEEHQYLIRSMWINFQL